MLTIDYDHFILIRINGKYYFQINNMYNNSVLRELYCNYRLIYVHF